MEKVDVLQKSKLFESLLPDELEMLSDLSQQKNYDAGEIVFKEGAVGDSLYVIEEGEVEVLRKGADGTNQLLATLKEPEFFGEMSLIDKEYRSATVRAKTDLRMLYLSNENLHSFAKVYKSGFTLVVINIARVLSTRLRETNKRFAKAVSKV